MSTNGYAEVSTHPPDVPSVRKSSDTMVPNRIFVGGISSHITEADLYALFSKYGSVKAAKIITDREGSTKGYGFVTFETEDEARRLQKEGNVMLGGKRLNIAPAVIKHRSQSPDPPDNTQCAYAAYGGIPPPPYNGLFCVPSYGVYLPQPAYSMILPHPQYVYPSQNLSPHLIYGTVPAATLSDPYGQSICPQSGQQEGSAGLSDQEETPKNINGRIAPLFHKTPNGSPLIYCEHLAKPAHFAKIPLASYPYSSMQHDRQQEFDVPDGMIQPSLLTPPPTPITTASKIHKGN